MDVDEVKIVAIIIFVKVLLLISIVCLHADDSEIFSAPAPPDVLILLDMSGSMNFDPTGNPTSFPRRKIDIAREVIKDLLDDNKDGKIDLKDEGSLNLRLGYMRFRDIKAFDNDENNPQTGKIKVLASIGSDYKNIWDQIAHPTERAFGGTPLAAALAEVKTYFLRDVNPLDSALACRKKFLIVITDGADTVACDGDGAEEKSEINKRRMFTIQRVKELYEAGISVFMVGLGETMPEHLKRTLNWAAKYGGTDNPFEPNRGDPEAYDIAKYGNPCLIPSTHADADPASYPLSGYAFFIENVFPLIKTLKAIAKSIQEQSFTFTAPIPYPVRNKDSNVVYQTSFIPNKTKIWKGNLKSYRLNENGTTPVDEITKRINIDPIWDAGRKLNEKKPSDRKIYIYLNGSLRSFIFENLTNEDLDFPPDPLYDIERQKLINHIRGMDAYDLNGDRNTAESREWKLGDIIHSTPVFVGQPSPFFEDEGFSGSRGFYDAYKDRTKVVIAGANDGMLHAFNATTGDEEWAFIPPSVVKNLKLMTSIHTDYVDSSPRVADVWIDHNGDNKKSANEWMTILLCGLRKGGKHYFALNITNTLRPEYLWEFPNQKDTMTLAKVGESWSEPAIGRVKIEIGGGLYERWVAFMGGGFDAANHLGKAFFVIDIKTGEIIKEFSGLDGMIYSLAAPPTMVDTNFDGYVDKIYIGDLGGQIWVFDVSYNPKEKKSNSRWTGKRLFKAPAKTNENHPIYYQPSVAFDRERIPWIYFGTGDREYPNEPLNPSERFYGVKDDGTDTSWEEKDLEDVTTSNTYNPSLSKRGWYIRLEKTEKVLAKPVVFNQLVYFTTYTLMETPNPCSVEGRAKLYIVEYLSGGGAFYVNEMNDLKGKPSQRSETIGVGVPSFPMITVNMKGKASLTVGTTHGQVFSRKVLSPQKSKEILYWREIIP